MLFKKDRYKNHRKILFLKSGRKCERVWTKENKTEGKTQKKTKQSNLFKNVTQTVTKNVGRVFPRVLRSYSRNSVFINVGVSSFFMFSATVLFFYSTANSNIQLRCNIQVNMRCDFSYLLLLLLFHLVLVYPFSTNVPLLYPLKTSENRKFSDIFRGYRSRTLV